MSKNQELKIMLRDDDIIGIRRSEAFRDVEYLTIESRRVPGKGDVNLMDVLYDKLREQKHLSHIDLILLSLMESDTVLNALSQYQPSHITDFRAEDVIFSERAMSQLNKTLAGDVIRSFSLVNCDTINGRDAKNIGAALQTNAFLENFSISGCVAMSNIYSMLMYDIFGHRPEIMPVMGGLDTIASAIGQHKSLKTVSINDMRMSRDETQTFQAAIEKSESISSFSLNSPWQAKEKAIKSILAQLSI